MARLDGYGEIRGDTDIFMGHYEINHGDTLERAIEMFTGKPVTTITGSPAVIASSPPHVQLKTKQEILTAISHNIAANRIVILGTFTTEDYVTNEHDIYANHSYTVLDVEGEKIKIRNPWGTGDPQGDTFYADIQDLIDHNTAFALGN